MPELLPEVNQFGQELLKIREGWACRGDRDPFSFRNPAGTRVAGGSRAQWCAKTGRSSTGYGSSASRTRNRPSPKSSSGAAVDAVRKEVAAREGGVKKGAMWSQRGNASRLSQDAAGQRKRLCRDCAEIGRAMGLREFLKDTWNYATRELAEEHLGSWCSWAARCRLEPFKKRARTVREHWDGILNYSNNWTTSAAIESLHSKLQLARSRARGFCNFDYFRTIAYWIAGGLKPGSGLPNLIPSQL